MMIDYLRTESVNHRSDDKRDRSPDDEVGDALCVRVLRPLQDVSDVIAKEEVTKDESRREDETEEGEEEQADGGKDEHGNLLTRKAS
jgi:hypothetical protein